MLRANPSCAKDALEGPTGGVWVPECPQPPQIENLRTRYEESENEGMQEGQGSPRRTWRP